MFFSDLVTFDMSLADFDELRQLLSRSADLLEGHPESDDIRWFIKLLEKNKR